MGVDADLDHGVVDGVMYVDVLAGGDEGIGLLIGRHGQTLDSLQELMRSAVQRQTLSPCRVMVDIEDYRKRRRSQLAERARATAAKVRRTGRPERLEPMNSYERKIIHDTASEVGGVETTSEGEDPERFVVIRKKG
jgi:spoIIIJ-associated protein